MRTSRRARGLGSAGLTLIELLVVLVVMVIAVGVAAPAFLGPERSEADSQLGRLLRTSRLGAASRGETLYLRIASSGQWQLEGAASLADGAVTAGSMTDYAGPSATIIVSPLGTCAFDVRSTDAWGAIALDPMTCEIVGP